MGRARLIPKQMEGVNVHRSVKMRMEAAKVLGWKYMPRAKFEVEPNWVA